MILLSYLIAVRYVLIAARAQRRHVTNFYNP